MITGRKITARKPTDSRRSTGAGGGGGITDVTGSGCIKVARRGEGETERDVSLYIDNNSLKTNAYQDNVLYATFPKDSPTQYFDDTSGWRDWQEHGVPLGVGSASVNIDIQNDGSWVEVSIEKPFGHLFMTFQSTPEQFLMIHNRSNANITVADTTLQGIAFVGSGNHILVNSIITEIDAYSLGNFLQIKDNVVQNAITEETFLGEIAEGARVVTSSNIPTGGGYSILDGGSTLIGSNMVLDFSDLSFDYATDESPIVIWKGYMWCPVSPRGGKETYSKKVKLSDNVKKVREVIDGYRRSQYRQK